MNDAPRGPGTSLAPPRFATLPPPPPSWSSPPPPPPPPLAPAPKTAQQQQAPHSMAWSPPTTTAASPYVVDTQWFPTNQYVSSDVPWMPSASMTASPQHIRPTQLLPPVPRLAMNRRWNRYQKRRSKVPYYILAIAVIVGFAGLLQSCGDNPFADAPAVTSSSPL